MKNNERRNGNNHATAFHFSGACFKSSRKSRLRAREFKQRLAASAFPARFLILAGVDQVLAFLAESEVKAGAFDIFNNPNCGKLPPLQSVNLWSDKGGIDIVNPLRQEESRLRTSLLPSLINTKRYNMHHGTEQIKIFEIAKVYLAGNKLPHEKNCLSILADTDYLTLKGIFESSLVNLGILSECGWITFNEPRLFRDERAARIQMDGMTIGYFGEASQELGFKTLSCLLEVDLDVLIEKSDFIKKYQNLPQYPTVYRDLAVIVNEETPWSSIEKCITDTKIAFLKEVNFFDVYRGKQIPSGKKSIAFNLCFQSPDRTLRSEEVDIELQAIVDSLQRILNVELRKT